VWRVPLLLAWLATQLPAIALGTETELDPLAAEKAQVHPQPKGDEPPARVDTGYRFRFGIGFVSGGAYLNRPISEVLATVIGIQIHLGVQIDDTFAVMYQGSATLLWPVVRDAVLLEVSPTKSLSFGAGVGIDSLNGLVAAGDGIVLDGANTAGIPLRLAWNVVTSEGPGRRTAMALSVELTPSFVIGGDKDFANGFVLGALGGISFEMY